MSAIQNHPTPAAKAGASGLLDSGIGVRADDIYERSNLTKRQLLIWTAQKLNPAVPMYNMIRTFAIEGEVSPEDFRKAFRAMIAETDAFRIVIKEQDGIPQLEFLPALHYEPEYLDFTQTADGSQAFQKWLTQRSARSLNLEERLFDSALIKIRADRYVWYLCQHHLITDAWSTLLVCRRMSDFYNRSRQYRLDQGPSLPRFADYIAFERAYRRSSRYQKDAAYWSRKLAEPLEPVSFYGKSLTGKGTSKYRMTFDLGTERSEKLRAIARDENGSSLTAHLALFNIFAALLAAYIHRVCGNRRVAIGAPFHNRSSASFKNTAGLLMEVCPLRIEVDEGDNFESLSRKVSREVREGLSHYMYSVGNPLQNKSYEVLLNYHNITYSNSPELPMKSEWLHSGHGDASEALALQVHDFDGFGRFVLYFDFNRDVFDEQQQAGAVKHFVNVVDAYLADRTMPLDHLDLLSEQERRGVLIEFNRTALPYPDLTIAQLFEAQAATTPNNVAVTFGSDQLTYTELNARSNRLARYLRTCGVAAETIVGIYADRSIEMVIGMLAVLKAGGAYLPLDPSFPRERLTHMLADSGALVLLTQSKLNNDIPPFSGKTVCVDGDWSLSPEEDADNLPPIAGSDNLAYLIYTSGSTGKPKGVQIQNAAVVNFLTSMLREPKLTETDILLSVTTLSFDIAALEIFLPLVAGARLVLVSRETTLDAGRLSSALRESGATVMQATPSTWRMLIESGWRGDPSLKVLCGGEALPRVLANQLLERCGELWNMYGPTETTIWSAIHKVRPGSGSVPIGRPIANTQLFVLDNHMRPVPFGVSGELYIGGAGLARGYLNRPELTAEKFIVDKVSGETDVRLYRTGDLVRRLNDGNIEFIGRNDSQIKIRGFRVELGEIESMLARYPGLREVAVTVREDTPGDSRIMAYVVPRDRAPSTTELRTSLRAKMPDYMIPSAFVIMDALPRTPNGKLDRRALPAPDAARPDLEISYVAPKDHWQAVMVRIWQEVLGIEQVGINDNFFELGGDSLIAVQVITKANQAGFRLTATDIFQHQSIAELTTILEAAPNEPVTKAYIEAESLTQTVGANGHARTEKDIRNEFQPNKWSYLVALQTEGSNPPFFWIHGENSNAFLARFLGANQPVYGVLHQCRDGKSARYTRIEEIAACYLEEIQSVQPLGPYFLGGFCVGGLIAFEMAQQLLRRGQETKTLLLLGPTNPGWTGELKNQGNSPIAAKRSFRDQVDSYFQDIKLLGTRQRITHTLRICRTKTAHRAAVLARAIREKVQMGRGILKMVAGEFYFRAGIRTIPSSIVNYYLDAMYKSAARAYQPHFYPGQVVVMNLQDTIWDSRQGFGNVTGKELEIVILDAKHDQVVYWEEQIRLVAEKIKFYLEEAQAGARAHRT